MERRKSKSSLRDLLRPHLKQKDKRSLDDLLIPSKSHNSRSVLNTENRVATGRDTQNLPTMRTSFPLLSRSAMRSLPTSSEISNEVNVEQHFQRGQTGGNKPYMIQYHKATRDDIGKTCGGCDHPFFQLGEIILTVRGYGSYLARYHDGCLKDNGSTCSNRRGRDIVLSYLNEASSAFPSSSRPSNEILLPNRRRRRPRDPGSFHSDTYTLSIGDAMDDSGKRVCPGLSVDILAHICTAWRVPTEFCTDDECPICLRRLISSDEATLEASVDDVSSALLGPVLQLPCATNHVFHAACIIPWLRKAGMCPTCRVDVHGFL